jgi:hypothetical protein
VNGPIDEFGQQAGLERRRSARQSVLFLADISRPDGSILGQVKVRNISSTGLMAETGLVFRPGETVILGLRGIGAVHGFIVRRTVNRIAVKFNEPIDPMLTRLKK